MAATRKKSKGGAPTGAGRPGWNRKNFAPVFLLQIEENGMFRPADDLLSKLVSVKIKESLTKATETKLVFRNDDLTLAEDTRFLGNTVWKYRFGYFNDLSPITPAILRNLEPEYDDKQVLITVTLYDYTLNASQTSSAKNWGRVKSSDIAKALAKKHGMKIAADDSNDLPKKAWIQPADLNDIQFLRDLACLVDFEVFVADDPPTLFYRKKRYDAVPKAQLVYYDDPSEWNYLKSFKLKVTSLGPYQSGVKGTDAEKGKGDHSTSQDPTKGNPGLANQDNLFIQIGRSRNSSGIGSTEVIAKPIASAVPHGTNTQKLAEVKRQQILDRANEATSEHPLTPSLVKGFIFEILGVEKPVAGKWYIVEVDHELKSTSATTKVTWKRNATNGKKDNKNVNNKSLASDVSNNMIVQIGRTRDGQGFGSQEVIPRNGTTPSPK